jgi:hypothetical protein
VRWLALLLVAACGRETVIYSTSDPWSTDPAPVSLHGRIVTTNNGDDTLSVFDPASGQVVGRVPVGFIPVELEGPHHIAADAAGAYVYLNLSEAVAGSGTGPHGAHGTGTQPGYTLKLAADTGRLVGQTRVEPNPGDLTLSADGATIYVTHYDLIKWTRGAQSGDLRMGDADLLVIDAASMTISATVPLCPAPHGVRTSADQKTLYSTCGPDEIAIVDLGDLAAGARRVPLPGYSEQPACERCPYAIGVAPDGAVWVSSLGAGGGATGRGGIDVYDPVHAAFDPARSQTLCGRAVFAAFTADKVYVPEQGCGDALDLYDLHGVGAGRIALTPAQCLNAHMILAAGDGATAWLVCEGDHIGPGSLVTIDLAHATVAAEVALGVFPDGLARVQ